MALLSQRARVFEKSEVAPGYLVLDLEVDAAIEARPGQFVMMRGEWGTSPLLPRPMSLLRGGKRPQVLMRVVGEGTRRLAAARLGEPVGLLGPLGTWFDDPAKGTRPVLVAGGVGVAPLWFLAERWAQEGLDRPDFLYGGRTARDLPGADRIAEITSLRITTEDGSRGLRGRVTAALGPMLEEAARESRPLVVYTCGPGAMMAAVAAMSRQASASCFASVEAPMACGIGVCLGCAVPRTGGGFLYACADGPVLDAAAVAWRTDG